MFIYLNANPSDIHTGDCVIRAIMTLEQQERSRTIASGIRRFYKVGEIMTTNDLKDKILQWCESRLQKPINTAEMKDISEIYDNLAKQETMVKMTESLNANNSCSCVPLTSGDGLNECSPECYIDGTSHARGRSPQTGRYVSRTEAMHHMDPIDYDHSGNRYYADMRSGHSIDDRMVTALEQMFDNAGSEHERGRIESVIAHIHNTGM